MYKPAAKRRWGYFALPILHHDRLVGKLDAIADRKASVLRVNAIHEDVRFTRAMTKAVQAEIEDLASWLGLEAVEAALGALARASSARAHAAGREQREQGDGDEVAERRLRPTHLRGPVEPRRVDEEDDRRDHDLREPADDEEQRREHDPPEPSSGSRPQTRS